jgi:Na+-driven multidrug efflux pump
MGVGDASLILLGQKLGENNMEEARIYAKEFIRAGLFVGIVVGLLLILLGRPIVGFFDFTEEGAMYTRHILTIFGVMMPVTLLNMIIVTGVLRSGGDTRFAMIADAGSVWILGIPAAFLSALVFHWPIDMCAAAIQLEALVKLVVIWVRYRQEKWVKNVIAGL